MVLRAVGWILDSGKEISNISWVGHGGCILLRLVGSEGGYLVALSSKSGIAKLKDCTKSLLCDYKVAIFKYGAVGFWEAFLWREDGGRLCCGRRCTRRCTRR